MKRRTIKIFKFTFDKRQTGTVFCHFFKTRKLSTVWNFQNFFLWKTSQESKKFSCKILRQNFYLWIINKTNKKLFLQCTALCCVVNLSSGCIEAVAILASWTKKAPRDRNNLLWLYTMYIDKIYIVYSIIQYLLKVHQQNILHNAFCPEPKE